MSHLVIRPETPRSLGYAMPAEWSRHRATWLSWPHNRETWPTQLERVREVWLRMIQLLSPQERVCLLVNDEPTRQDVIRRLTNARAALDNVTIFQIPTVDVWMRDYGPTFVIRDSQEIVSLLQVPVFNHPVVLEGGSIEVNGLGTCLTTEQCLLNKNRNPHMSRREIEEFLKDSLGVDQVIWLGQGIVGDDTDGHIDDIARFVNPATIVCIVEENSKDTNYSLLQQNLERLQAARDQNDHKLSIVPLPCPGPVYYEGARLPASYANFYIANGVVLVPLFDDPCDVKALGILQELFPDRKVVGLPCTAVVAGLGAIHCVTQQEPAVPSGP